MHTLSNGIVEIKIATKGAELKSLWNHNTGLEYMWQAGPEWAKTSPVLFPIVGGLKNNKYTHNGTEYTLGRHGFARDMDFTLISQDHHSFTFLLEDSEATTAVYPFAFSFYIKYTLHEDTLQISFIINNNSDSDMYFSVGAHPAFAVPLVPGSNYEDYFLEFEVDEAADRWLLSADGLIETTPEPYLQHIDQLPLSKELFAKDAIVFKHLASREISLKSTQHTHGLKVRFDGFPYMGIWSAPNADFVCIEPWCGIADSTDANGSLQAKEGIIKLEKGGSLERSYGIRVF